MNATDFFEAVGISHIIAVALRHFNMNDAKRVPQDPRIDLDYNYTWFIRGSKVEAII